MKKGLYLVLYLVIGGAWLALSATCILGYMGVAGPMAKNMTAGLATITDCMTSCLADPSEANCQIQQAKVNELANSFTGGTELPEWITEIQEFTGTPDMAEDDNYLSFMLNAVPEGVQELFTEGKIVDVANGDLEQLDFVDDFVDSGITEEELDAAIAQLEELKKEFSSTMDSF